MNALHFGPKSVPPPPFRSPAGPAPVPAPKAKHVLIAMDWLDQDLMLGIADYARRAGWVLEERVRVSAEPPASWSGDGVLTLLRNPNGPFTQFIARCTAPVVDLANFVQSLPLPRVLIDNVGIGRTGAQHLIDSGLRYLSFANLWDGPVEVPRLEGFRDAVERAGRTYVPLEFNHRQRTDQSIPAMIAWLREELVKAPRPLGVMAVHDREAMLVAQACAEVGILVPEEVAIVGVANDAVMRETGPVPLSSVDNRRREQGYRAAELLEDLMAGKRPPLAPIVIPSGPVVVRRSSELLAVPDPDLSKALAFIAQNFRKPIDVDDVVKHSLTTRRHLYALFEKHLGRPITAEIRRRRLDLARRLLATSGDKLHVVARSAGFKNAQQLTRTFSRELGISPKDFRLKERRITGGN